MKEFIIIALPLLFLYWIACILDRQKCKLKRPDCDECNGSGWINYDDICLKCQGEGWV